uniref:Uncharacterized protein n=1 Tax=Rhinopithecus bieti TaxID=61621 RepID=A0A2K6JR86_RHIBE
MEGCRPTSLITIEIHVSIEPWKYSSSKLRCAVSIKYIPDFEDVPKNVNYHLSFCTGEISMFWYSGLNKTILPFSVYFLQRLKFI